MKRLISLFAIFLIMLVIVASTACGQLPNVEDPAGEDVYTLGFTTSLSGIYAEESDRQTKGLILWIDQINDQGGLRLSTGELITLTYQLYDDRSDPEQVKLLYEKLILEDEVDLLIGPYSSDLNDAAAFVANQYGIIMLSAGAASDSIFQHDYLNVYQIYTPAREYLTPTLNIISIVDPDAKRIALLTGSDSLSMDATSPVAPRAEILGYSMVYQETYEIGTTDFSSYVQAIQAAQPDILLAGGTNEDGFLLAQELDRQNVEIKFITLLISPSESSFGDLGDAAIGIIGPSQWETDLIYSPMSTNTSMLNWYGPTNQEFIMAYEKAYGETPTYHAAGGYATGLVLQYAIEEYQSLNPPILRLALESTMITTFFGQLNFVTTDENYGMQVGHELVYVQWQQDNQGKLVKRVIWPIELATGPLIYPIP